MNPKFGLICGIAAGITLAIGSGISASAAKPVAIEKELLGVRVLQNYRQVLARYGAPTRIFRATQTVTYQEATTLAGGGTGGIVGIADASSGGGGGGMGGGGPMMGGAMAGMMSPPGGGGKGGGAMSAGSPMMGSGAPEYPGLTGGSGGNSGGGGAGGGQAGDNPDASYTEAGGFVWVYLYPTKKLAYEFHFNKDGRVERIAELGNSFGQHTSRGIGLGDPVDKIYGIYGWTDRIKDEENGRFSLLYNDKYHAQFLVLKNRVVGISVFLKENQFMQFNGTTGGGGGGMMAGSSGGPRGGGLMGTGGPGPAMSGPSSGGMMGGKRGGPPSVSAAK